MRSLGGTKHKIIKGNKSKNVYHSEIVEVVLVHCNIVNNDYQQDSRVMFKFVLNEFLVNY